MCFVSAASVKIFSNEKSTNTSTLPGSAVGPRLDAMPVGRFFHRRLLALIGAGLFLDGFELYSPLVCWSR